MFRRPLPVPRLRPFALAALALFALAPAQADAQRNRAPAKEKRPEKASGAPSSTTDSTVSIPREMMPPAGKCRIWMRGVPPTQQPAPTDCTTALRQAPANGVLVFGPALRDLSPFDVRNPNWSARSSDLSRQRASGRSDTSAPAPVRAPGALPALTPGKSAAVRDAKVTTRSAAAAREAPPPPKDPPPTKKPE